APWLSHKHIPHRHLPHRETASPPDQYLKRTADSPLLQETPPSCYIHHKAAPLPEPPVPLPAAPHKKVLLLPSSGLLSLITLTAQDCPGNLSAGTPARQPPGQPDVAGIPG